MSRGSASEKKRRSGHQAAVEWIGNVFRRFQEATEAWPWQGNVKAAPGCCGSVARLGIGRQRRGLAVGSRLFGRWQRGSRASFLQGSEGDVGHWLGILQADTVETGSSMLFCCGEPAVWRLAAWFQSLFSRGFRK